MKPPKSRSIRLTTQFPKTREFGLAIAWLSLATKITMPKLLYWTDSEGIISINYHTRTKVKRDNYIMNEHSNETRARLSFLLRILGYSEEEIFTDYFPQDSASKHLPYHEEWSATLKQDNEILTRHWAAIEIKKGIQKFGGKDIVGQAIKWFNRRNPSFAVDEEEMRNYLKDEVKTNEDDYWADIRYQRIGVWNTNISDTFVEFGARFVRCVCYRCGHKTYIKRAHLRKRNTKPCPVCVKRRRKWARERHKQLRRKQLLFDVKSGKRYKKVRTAYRELGLDKHLTYTGFHQALGTRGCCKAGDQGFILMTVHQFYKRLYAKHLPELGLPDDYQIPNDPDGKENKIQGVLRYRAQQRRLKSTAAYQKRREWLKQNAPFNQRIDGFWGIKQIKEHREAAAQRGRELLKKLKKEDEFVLSQLP